jgi:hypothetical protein
MPQYQSLDSTERGKRRLTAHDGRPGRKRGRRSGRLGLKARDGAATRLREDQQRDDHQHMGQSRERAIAVPSGMTAVAKPIAVINIEPIARPAL